MSAIRMFFASVAFIYSCGVTAGNGPSQCATIDDSMARLACFDSYFPPSESVVSIETLSSPYEARQKLEEQSEANRFALTPHKPNYILPATYNFSADYSQYGQLGDTFSDAEVKLQLSLKTRLAENLWGDSSLWMAYTQRSWWQLYADEEASAPFRETNHEPELIWQIPVNFQFLGMNARQASIAFNHQSNGGIDPISRSWNRITGSLVFERGRFVASAKTWVRVDDDDEDDDNPNIEDYMGRMELGLAYRGDKNTFALGVKNSMDSEFRSGVEFNWMFPLTKKLNGFFQLYSGYGESMIDMENYTNRIGIGISLSDWL